MTRGFAISLALCLSANDSAAGKLADSYGHLPVSDWGEMDGSAQVGVSEELATEKGKSKVYGGVAINTCMRGIARDVRYKTRSMNEALSYCADHITEYGGR